MENMLWSAMVNKRQINNFLYRATEYCKRNNLKDQTFKTFLNHKEEGDYVSKSFSLLFGAPKILLANSVAFEQYYNSLDEDFKSDLISYKEIRDLRIYGLKNKLLQKFLKQTLGQDYVY